MHESQGFFGERLADLRLERRFAWKTRHHDREDGKDNGRVEPWLFLLWVIGRENSYPSGDRGYKNEHGKKFHSPVGQRCIEGKCAQQDFVQPPSAARKQSATEYCQQQNHHRLGARIMESN